MATPATFIYKQLRRFPRVDEHYLHMVIGFVMRAAGSLCSVIVVILLARDLGAGASGVFYAGLTLASGLMIIGKLGLDASLVRIVPPYFSSGNFRRSTSIFDFAIRTSLMIAGVTALLTLLFVFGLYRNVSNPDTFPLYYGWLLLVIVPLVLNAIHSAMLKATGAAIAANFFEATLWPAFTLIFVLGLRSYDLLTREWTAFAFLTSAIIAACASYLSLRYTIRSPSRISDSDRQELFNSCIPNAQTELLGFILVWAPFLLMPVLGDADDSGVFNVAHRLSGQFTLIVIATMALFGHSIATFRHAGRMDSVRRLAGQCTFKMSVLGVLLVAAIAVIQHPLIMFLGSDYRSLSSILWLLVGGHFINLVLGPAGYLLALTGHEVALRNCTLISCCFVAVTAPLAIVFFGIDGAASSAVGTMLFHKLICLLTLSRKTELPMLLILTR